MVGGFTSVVELVNVVAGENSCADGVVITQASGAVQRGLRDDAWGGRRGRHE